MHQSSLFGDPAPRQPGELHRLFFALWPDADTRAGIRERAQALEAAQRPGGRMIGAHRYHLTLQFLGDFDPLPQSLAERAAAAAATVRTAAFDLVLDRAGSFANRDIPWWLGSAQPDPGLTLLWDRLGVALAKHGVKVVASHRAHAPHVTIVRQAERGLATTPVEPLRWRIDRFVLLHSELGRRNEYSLLGEWRLPD
ncbi:RNA 2',3'-cyclic phosphodiesterase [Lysobacter sp. K5869]|uniref:RNA 2',3'-cyclic phosphodiesterase n=1 Tax=Lysobacter sp. K5869 TaxID=2820808 RepID=UPI001C062419|nr:RNA 2',3'-cyclic phosphodiesterase [Lysobacter sp. K5869]QWP74853.1 RNA 2',3'-cyclic phosphodiesterase [Lysobacter sp. K5869]